MLPVLLLLSLLLGIIATSAAAFVNEKQFSQQVESKLVVDHLIFLAYCDLREMLTPEIAKSGILTYEKGIVMYEVTETTEETIKVRLNASNEFNGKSQVTFNYHYMQGKAVRWEETR